MNIQSKNNFLWFRDKEDRRRALRVSVGLDGKLRLGKPLRQLLPAYILVGFDPRAKALAIADGHGAGIGWPKCGTLTLQALSAQISSTGLRLPVSFHLTRDEQTGYFLGRVIPRRLKGGEAGGQYDMEQLMVLYQHILEKAVHSQAKSMPLSERRACAMEAFCCAAQSYRPSYGDLDGYLAEQVQKKLLQENRPYVAAYRDRSLDQPLRQEEGESFCLYDTSSAACAGGIDELEDRIMLEQFLESLSHQERTLFQLLRQGDSLAAIAGELGTSESDLVRLARQIGRKRRSFYGEK